MYLKSFRMCSMHLLLNCIILFHLAPQLSLWAKQSNLIENDLHFQSTRQPHRTCSSHDHLINQLNYLNPPTHQCTFIHRSPASLSIDPLNSKQINEFSQPNLKSNFIYTSSTVQVPYLLFKLLIDFSVSNLFPSPSSANSKRTVLYSIVGAEAVSSDIRGHRKSIVH